MKIRAKLERRIKGRKLKFWGPLDIDETGKGTYTIVAADNEKLPNGVELELSVTSGKRGLSRPIGIYRFTYDHRIPGTGEYVYMVEEIERFA